MSDKKHKIMNHSTSKTSGLFFLIITILLTIGENQIYAQTLRLNAQTFNMIISGTTNVHNFKSKVNQASGEIVINSSKQPQSMVVEIPVKSIKSGDKLMDKKTYETFNADKNPTITFKFTEAKLFQVKGNDVNVTAIGTLTMSGTTKIVTLKSNGRIIKPGIYEFKGNVILKMNDFKMSPPEAMMGLMKVGDVVTVDYTVTFEGDAII